MVGVRRVAVGLLLSALVAGCSSDEPPRPAPLPAPASSAATPAASDPPLPPEAAAPTSAGAAATAVYFYEELGRALIDQDTSGLRKLSTPACETCLRFANTIDRSREDGERYEGGAVDVRIGASTDAGQDRAAVVLLYSAAPLRRVDVPSTPGPATTNVRLTVQLVRSSGTWLVDKIARVGE